MHRLANDAQPPAYGVRPAAKKIPVSVLVVVYCVELEVLLLERADRPGSWQSVTGSKDDMSEDLVSTAARELREETGIEVGGNVLPRTALIDWDQRNVYEIHPAWRDRYAAGITHIESVSCAVAIAVHDGNLRWDAVKERSVIVFR